MAKVKQELHKKTPTQKADYGEMVTGKLEGNPDFPSLNPNLTSLKTVTSDLRQAHKDMLDAHKVYQEKVNKLNQSSSAFDSLFTQVGSHIENVSNGDEAKIHGTGMEVQKTKSRIGLPKKVVSLNATISDNAGEIDVQWDTVKGAKTYIIEAAINDGSPIVWSNIAIVTKIKTTLKMKSGVSYQIRVAAVGTAGQGPWSDPIIKVAP
jgi:hypothetical protein